MTGGALPAEGQLKSCATSARSFKPMTSRNVRDAVLVLGNLVGTHRHPERYSCRFSDQVAQARRALGANELPTIRLHDLHHAHATLLLADGVPVKVASERLGHASATIALTVSQHVHAGMVRQVADRFAALLEG
jgi:integrase